MKKINFCKATTIILIINVILSIVLFFVVPDNIAIQWAGTTPSNAVDSYFSAFGLYSKNRNSRNTQFVGTELAVSCIQPAQFYLLHLVLTTDWRRHRLLGFQ